jgi:hypothetical protein
MAGREGPAKQKGTSHPPDYLGLLWMTFSRSSLLSHAHDIYRIYQRTLAYFFICFCSCSLRISTMPHGWNGSSDYIITCTTLVAISLPSVRTSLGKGRTSRLLITSNIIETCQLHRRMAAAIMPSEARLRRALGHTPFTLGGHGNSLLSREPNHQPLLSKSRAVLSILT